MGACYNLKGFQRESKIKKFGGGALTFLKNK